jgi:hypothetical protein
LIFAGASRSIVREWVLDHPIAGYRGLPRLQTATAAPRVHAARDLPGAPRNTTPPRTPPSRAASTHAFTRIFHAIRRGRPADCSGPDMCFPSSNLLEMNGDL